ncbi:hydrogenase maturation nickel metallochaperone HypA [Crassaminicella profunda]|uniref:hydrogenase maturation nickel metallochaperone HypA n=1 Tax=Crassaminicella profunda TaxID=1286698 RepID=UPI001CA761D2|nr:hydrogenase maturation nickel metallochaperone HypA [Crassaminicella profunda]QZY53966.1 hydrogenase maturation nickel metallochaperone HypA [Crassaminicella profunda]
MHEGCSGSFQTGKEVVDKIRMMGFSKQYMPVPLRIQCEECDETFDMETFEDHCPHCKMVYGVTPCHAFDPENVRAAGKDY